MSQELKQVAPEFTLMSHNSEEISLSDYKGKWVVLFFYPLDFTFVCPTELHAFQDKLAEFEALGAEVIGVNSLGLCIT